MNRHTTFILVSFILFTCSKQIINKTEIKNRFLILDQQVLADLQIGNPKVVASNRQAINTFKKQMDKDLEGGSLALLLYYQAWNEINSGDVLAAEKLILQSIELDPYFANAHKTHLLLGHHLNYNQKKIKAIWEKVILTEPKGYIIELFKIDSAIQNQDWDTAERALEIILNKPNTPPHLLAILPARKNVITFLKQKQKQKKNIDQFLDLYKKIFITRQEFKKLDLGLILPEGFLRGKDLKELSQSITINSNITAIKKSINRQKTFLTIHSYSDLIKILDPELFINERKISGIALLQLMALGKIKHN